MCRNGLTPTLEQGWIEQRLYEIGVNIIEKHALMSAANGEARIQHIQSGRERALPCASLLLVTMRLPNDSLYHDLAADAVRLQNAGIVSLTRIGDCLAPSTIAAAVYAGHRYAREADAPPVEGVPFAREWWHWLRQEPVKTAARCAMIESPRLPRESGTRGCSALLLLDPRFPGKGYRVRITPAASAPDGTAHRRAAACPRATQAGWNGLVSGPLIIAFSQLNPSAR